MNIKISPGPLSGSVAAIPSKSEAHRLLICAALADAEVKLRLDSLSDDISATVSCLRAMGAGIEAVGGDITVTPIKKPREAPLLDCRESGSTLRFLLPVAAALCNDARFTGTGRLPQRPVGHLMAAMEKNGVSFSANTLPFSIGGRLRAGEYVLPGDVSSQYVTGLLLALPGLSGDSVVKLTSPLESAAYVNITESSLGRFGVHIDETESGYHINGSQTFRSPGSVSVPGDWSNAAVFLAAGALGQPVTVTGLDVTSPQGDKVMVDIIRRFGAEARVEKGSVTVSPAGLCGCVIDGGEAPDIVPALAVLAAFAKGESRITNCSRLALKESDRLQATTELIKALGGEAEAKSGELVIQGGGLRGGMAPGVDDHRMVMAAALAAVGCTEPVTIMGAEAVMKSYPGFFRDYAALGGAFDVI